MYIIALLGSFILFFITSRQQSLRKPKYLFLSTLAIAELLLSTSMVPRTFTVFWIRVRDVSFGACLAQVLLVHFILLPSQ